MNTIFIDKEYFIKVCNESNTKQDAYLKLGMHRNTFQKYCDLFDIKFKRKQNKKVLLQDVFDGKRNYPNSKLNYRLIKEGYKERKCEICGNTHWMGKPIMLELHHVDGNHTNNKLENLQLLCPNCHSLTDNFKSKNIKHYNIEFGNVAELV
ncbi:MAG: HNH endonuclease [Clostridia bacterium]|nr:HNH endonuclease [Clostridia bacterium]